MNFMFSPSSCGPVQNLLSILLQVMLIFGTVAILRTTYKQSGIIFSIIAAIILIPVGLYINLAFGLGVLKCSGGIL